MIFQPHSIIYGGRYLGKHAQDTFQGFHVISRNLARNFSFRALRTAGSERFREIREITASPSARFVSLIGQPLALIRANRGRSGSFFSKPLKAYIENLFGVVLDDTINVGKAVEIMRLLRIAGISLMRSLFVIIITQSKII